MDTKLKLVCLECERKWTARGVPREPRCPRCGGYDVEPAGADVVDVMGFRLGLVGRAA